MKNGEGNVVNSAYVIDKDFRIVHYNDEIKKLYPDLEIGDICYERLQEASCPCKVCPVTTLKKEGLLFYNKARGLWVDCMAAPLGLTAGKEDHVVICHAVTQLREDQKEEALRLLEGEGKERNELTGLYQREVFLAKVAALLCASRPSEYCMAVLDVENFKLYNTLYGFDQGNDFLHYIGYSMKEVLQDIGFAGYMGGDNFAAVLPNRQEVLVDLLERMKYYVDSRRQNSGFYPAIGIIVIDDTEALPETIYDKASMAVTMLRGNYLTRMIWYDDSMICEMENNYVILNDLKRGLEQDEFLFYLQPQCSMVDQRIIGMEALCRWQHPDKGLLMPDSFIPQMEKNGLITELDCCIWEKVCRMLKKWQELDKQMVPVSVNISRLDIFERNVVEIFENLIEQYHIPKQYLEIEVTESAYAESELVVKRTIDQLRERGFTVLMDDFGSGYSSLNMLQNISVDVVKLDMRFLHLESESEGRGIHILEMIFHLAQSLNIKIIAEGVETEKQRNVLLQMGCEYAQGYFYYKPMSVAEAEMMLETTGIGSREERHTTPMPKLEQVSSEARIDPQKLLMQLDNLSERLQIEQKKLMVYETAMDNYFDERIEVDFKHIGRDAAAKNILTLLGKKWKLPFSEREKIRNVLNLDNFNPEINGILRSESVMTEDNRELKMVFMDTGRQKLLLCVRDQGTEAFEKIMLKHPLLWSYDYDVTRDIFQITSGSDMKSSAVKGEDFYHDLRSKELLTEDSFRALKESMTKAAKMPVSGVVEYETREPDGTKRWKRMYYVSLANQKGEIYRIAGIAADIQNQHTREEKWKDKANRDQMSGLLNHDAALYYMQEALEESGGGVLLSLDIDDFKQINDKAGHLQGDECIRKLSELLRGIFRKEDILGRMGGDEFLIFMPGVISIETARQRVQELFLKMKRIWIPRFGEIKCSIGISSSIEKDITINSLRKQADYALYEAKNSGKGHIVSIVNGEAVHDGVAVIDENEVVNQTGWNKEKEFVGELFLIMYHAASKTEGITRALAFIGEKMDVSRVYIFAFDDKKEFARNTYEWCAKGIAPEIDQLQKVSLDEWGFDLDKLYENGMWFVPDVSMLQDARTREFLERQNIRGMLHWLLRRKGDSVGMIGFDECRENVNWTSQDAEILKYAGEVLSRFILSDD